MSKIHQKEFLSSLCENNRDAVIVSSLGTISYNLAEIEHPNKILVKGAMGNAMSIGLGYALGTDKKVIVVIGDGSFLMKMGNIATVIRQNLDNLRIIVLNNGCYKSCDDGDGAQKTNFDYIRDMIPFEVYDVE